MRATDNETEARTKQQPYRCFLVRCRLEEGAGPNGEAAWRFTVQHGEPNAARRSFTCLHHVAAYLEAELASCAFAHKPTKSQREKTL